MQAPEEFIHPHIGSRRNWTVCWRWSLSVLAVEFALVMALIGFALNSRSNSHVKVPSQVEQAQQNPVYNRKVCPVHLRKTQEL
jgi:hypothetical protein